MARVWQRYLGSTRRAAKASRRKPRKPQDVRVQGAGHKHRTVNAPKAW
jgi:hypothetical protein